MDAKSRELQQMRRNATTTDEHHHWPRKSASTPTTPRFQSSHRRDSSSEENFSPITALSYAKSRHGPSLKRSPLAPIQSRSATMPLDSSGNKNNPPNRPLQPTLASNRQVKSPITPRLAAQHRNATASPALSIKSTSNVSASARGVRSPILKEDVVSPASLSSNITPRSTARKSRIESANCTPNGTPTGTPVTAKNTPGQDQSGWRAAPNGLGTGSLHGRPNSVVLDGDGLVKSPLIRATTFSPSPRPESSNSGSAFFHANDAKTQEPQLQQKKAPTFFYANGAKEEQAGRPTRAPSPPLSTVSAKSGKSQFYHADGTLDADAVPPLPSLTPNLQLAQTSPTLRPSNVANSFPLRPPSPQKANLHLTFRKGASQIISPQNRNNAIAILPPVSGQSTPRQRSTSIEAQWSRGHQRGTSLGSVDTSGSSRKSSLTTLDAQPRISLLSKASPTSAFPRSQAPTSYPGPATPIEESKDTVQTPGTSRPASGILSASPSPIQQPPPPSQPNPLAEAAANARRERKVLDLEISNSSLLAINRSLEREVRKQKAELRRFRRLSRAGRLTSFGALPDNPADSDSESGSPPHPSSSSRSSLSNSDMDDESDADDLSDESNDTSSGSLSSSRLAKDEKRLHLDLARHRQLLVDSQKMNQSLKRCTAWTEEMIREARRALAYQVRVSDIKLGGRVLEREDIGSSVVADEGSVQNLAHFDEVEMPEDSEDGDLPERHGLLGRWTPSNVSTPLATVGAMDEYGLGIGLEASITTPSSDHRDSGVHVEDLLVDKLDQLSLESPIKLRSSTATGRGLAF